MAYSTPPSPKTPTGTAKPQPISSAPRPEAQTVPSRVFNDFASI